MSDTEPGGVYEKSKSRRGYGELPAIDPHDGGTWTVLVSGRTMERVKSRGLGATRELADTVKWSLSNIRHLFRGLRDDEDDVDDDGWLCYVARPNHAYDWKTTDRVPPWEGEVFLVYVTDERVVYQWKWVKADPENPNLPIDHNDRFKVKVF
jgi:hypothetical protein